MTVRCVVFDIDDTLYLERDYARSGFAAVGEWARVELGVVDFAERAWVAFEAGLRGTIFDRVLGECGVEGTAAVIEAAVGVYRRHRPILTLSADAAEVILRLHGRVALAAITDGPAMSQRAKAEALELSRWFVPIIFTAELGEGLGKPHPAAFRHVAEVLGRRGAECVYVADNPLKDFSAPRSLGWRTVRVRRAGGLHAALESGADVDLELSDLGGLLEWLGL